MLAVGLALAALVSQTASHRLCGRRYTDRAQLLQQLSLNKDVVHTSPYDQTYFWIDQKLLTVWWIHFNTNGPDYITCIRKWETNHGFVDGRIESDCGDNKSACQAQAHDMIGIKF